METSLSTVSRKISSAASPKLKSSGQCCRIKFRSSSGNVTVRCRKNHSISFQEKADPIFDELQELPECIEFQRLLVPAPHDSDYLKLRPDFSVHKFWSELSDLEFDPDVSSELPNFPEMDGGFDFLPKIDDGTMNFEDAKDFGYEMKVLEQEKGASSLKWMDFLNPCSFFDPDDGILETIPRTMGSRKPESEIVELESKNKSSIVPLSSAQLVDDDAEIVASGMMIKKSSTSARSHKKKRLNPALARGSFGESFKFKKISADMDDLQEVFPYENLKCNEVLTDSDSEGKSVEIVSVTPSYRTPKKKFRGNANKHHLPEQSVNVMKAWMERHMSNPYATNDEKLELAKLSGMTLHQVDNWLSNTRYRLKIQKARLAKEDDPEVTDSKSVRKTLVARNKKKIFFSW